ncbi:pentatricopeptide repeat-containing protein At4g21170 [Malania oleifera]|uniref:pentatricopeptide repeat-containing protein At4g21170 n=1 Tax=Malania oleifera TaxID=397392 RepID=UPI0025AE0401|nr:pentatricopeptide repeat-containing protein At4g21170 [Malania oleifera]
MLLPNLHLSSRTFCTSTRSISWRNQIRQKQLVSQVSSILLQRHNWVPLLRTFNLSSKLTQSLFLQILRKTQTNPQISINFFTWAKTNLGFQPDLRSHCEIIRIALEFGLFRPAKPFLDSLTRSEPTAMLVQSMIQACRGKESLSQVLSFVLEGYANKGLIMEGLDVFKKIRAYDDVPSVRACNALLTALEQANEVRTAWCFFGAVIRGGVSIDTFTWALVTRILCKNGKSAIIARMLDSGIYNSVVYNVIIDLYCKRGNFMDAIDRLNEMSDRNLHPGFSTYSSILDGACKYGNVEVIQTITSTMVEKGLLLTCPSEYDSIIQKLSDLGKTYAAEMFYRRAQDENSGLKDATYGCILKALSREGRQMEATEAYYTISKMGRMVNDSSYSAFVNVICREDPSENVSELLRHMIQRGFNPCASELSKFITAQCKKGRWGDAEELLNVILEKGSLPDYSCCCLLIKHYCNSGQVDSAIVLHDKIEKLNGKLDVTTYTVLLNELFLERRIEEAVNVFDYMRRHSLLNSLSFSIMISGLCHEKERRRAMKLHDEMVKMGFKPDEASYKHLITGFM